MPLGSSNPGGPGGSPPAYQPPWWVEPAIYAATSLGGAAISNRANKGQAAQQAALQKEFAQYGIRWRVEDAKAAGLHPLYALGAQVPSYTPVSYSDSMGSALAASGQALSGAIATSRERRHQELALRLAEKQIEESDARIGVLRSERARNLMEAYGRQSLPPINMGAQDLIGEAVSTSGGAKLVPPEVTMSRPESKGIVAGPAGPSLREYVLPGGFRMMLPDANSLSEALEPLSESWALGAMVYKENVRLYGPEWKREFWNRNLPSWLVNAFMGRPPVYRRAPSNDQERRSRENPKVWSK